MCEPSKLCQHPEKMTGNDPEDCSLKQIKECHPEFYAKIMNLWAEEEEQKQEPTD